LTSDRKTALIAGLLFLATFVTSIPELGLYHSVLTDHHYILGGGADTEVYFGAFLEVLLAITGIGTAVVLFPVLKRQSEAVSLGYVATRILESTVIVIGLLSVLSIVTLRQDVGGAGAAHSGSLVVTARSLVAIHDWTFLLGPAFCAGFGNGILLGYLMYRSGLMPRGLAILGIVGGCLAFGTATAVLFNAYDQTSAVSSLLTVPEIIWELSIGIYLTFKGFKPSPILSVDASPSLQPV
jgi:Domain of unknown function (DUF4386)